MPIDPQIPLGIRPQQVAPLQLQTPIDRYQKMLTLRHLMQQGQLGQMNLEQTRLENERLQREAQNEQSLGSWMQQNQRPDLTPQEIVTANPNPTGIKFATAWSAQKTAELTQHKAFLDNAFEEAKTDDRIYNSVNPKDPQSKYAALAELVRLKRLTGEQAAQIGGLPDEEFQSLQQRAAAQSLDRLQRIKARQDEIALRIAQATETSKTEGEIAEGTSKTLDAAQKQKASDAAMVAAGFEQGPQAGAAIIAALGKIDSKRAERFKDITTAEGARNVGLTVEQQAADARAAAQLEQGSYGKTKVYPPPVQTQRIEEAAARASASQNVLLTPAKVKEITDIKAAAAAMEPATEAENRSLGFYDRSAEADKTLENVKDHIKNKSTAGMWLIQNAPNATLSKEDQAYMQGARQFINAYLRRDSGAAIQPSEWDEAYRTFLPYPGDKPETLALKARERKVIIEGLKTSAGRAYGRKYGEPDATAPKKHEKGSDPGGIR